MVRPGMVPKLARTLARTLTAATKGTARLARGCRSAARLAAATRGTAARSRGRKHARLIRAVGRSARAPKRRATHEQWHMPGGTWSDAGATNALCWGKYKAAVAASEPMKVASSMGTSRVWSDQEPQCPASALRDVVRRGEATLTDSGPYETLASG